MRERWRAEIRSRAADRWPAARQRAELGGQARILPVIDAAPLLRVLGLMDRHGDLGRDAVRKYKQIDHMVALLEPPLLDLVAATPVVRLLDAGCGSSYLTLLLAWCLEHRWRHPFQALGVDRDATVIEASRGRARELGLEGSLRFERGAIGPLDTPARWEAAFDETLAPGDLHALVSLHACDTATDDAIALGIGLGVDLLAAAPCCQAELARGWAARAAERATDGGGGAAAAEPPAPPFAPIWASPHLRREAAATVTDAMRALLLRGCGYRVTAMEFVPSTHTPKNTLLRARRDGPPGGLAPAALAEYAALRRATGGVGIRLEGLLPPRCRPHLPAG